ncbi:7044_t:CDS:2, partial [Ambispora gerdemannii]
KITPIEDKQEEVAKHFKKALNSDYPAAEIYNNCYITELLSLVQNYKNIEKSRVKLSPQANPDDYLKPYDIVKLDRKGGVYQHVAIYLGNKKVAHIPDPKSSVKIDKPELIKKHIDIAVKAGYGKDECNVLENNCEHFATMCVYGLGICHQKNLNTLNKITKGSEYLLQAIQESNQFFEELEKEQLQHST